MISANEAKSMMVTYTNNIMNLIEDDIIKQCSEGINRLPILLSDERYYLLNDKVTLKKICNQLIELGYKVATMKTPEDTVILIQWGTE